MRFRSLIIFCFIVLLLAQVVAQRGGGSRSSSRGRRSSKNSSSSDTFWTYVVTGLIALTGMIFGPKRDQNVSKHFEAFEKTLHPNSSLTEEQRNEAIDRLKQTSWNIKIKVGSPQKTSQWDLTLNKINKRKDFVHDFQGAGLNDQNGISKIKGILIFTQQGLKICFEKNYKDKNKAGQTGKWDLLIYEATQTNGVFEGKWFFKGFQKHFDYSGSMKMKPI